jgi:hypothetical protein
METYKTVIGTKTLNEYVKLGWKRVHVFTKPTEWTDEGAPQDYDAAFVIVWDSPGEPPQPKKPGDSEGEPSLPAYAPTDSAKL